jgi:ribosomal protein S3AE
MRRKPCPINGVDSILDHYGIAGTMRATYCDFAKEIQKIQNDILKGKQPQSSIDDIINKYLTYSANPQILNEILKIFPLIWQSGN